MGVRKLHCVLFVLLLLFLLNAEHMTVDAQREKRSRGKKSKKADKKVSSVKAQRQKKGPKKPKETADKAQEEEAPPVQRELSAEDKEKLGLEDLRDGFQLDVDETSLSAGFEHTCAIQQSGRNLFGGKVVCWGENGKGQCDPDEGDYMQVSAGQFHTCALHTDESVKCWGIKGAGQDPTGQFLQVSAGGLHSCGVRKDGTLKCWGKNFENQASPPEGRFVQVSSGKDHSCAIDTYGLVQCWGGNFWGQSAAPENTQFLQLSSSLWFHTCGVTIDKNVECWGANSAGQAEPRDGPFEQISAGAKYTCGIKVDASDSSSRKKLECWGLDGIGMNKIPESLQNIEQVTLGSDHACGHDADSSEVVCWGDDHETDHFVPEGLILS